jgi:hypothetical protein
MGFFTNVSRVASNLFEESSAALGDVVENIGDTILGARGTRGRTAGSIVGGTLYGPTGAVVGGRLGEAVSADVAAAPSVAREQQRTRQLEAVGTLNQAPMVTDQNFEEMLRSNTENPRTAGFDTGTVLDIRYPRSPQQTIAEAGVDILTDAYDYFFAEDDNQPSGMTSGMMMCPPSAPKAFNVNKQTGCVTITRKQQAKLKEAVRMFGGQQVARNLGISQQLLQQLLLKTFRARRRGISGADIRAVKRVDRQMHSLAMSLGGISSTSKAVAARRSPSKR